MTKQHCFNDILGSHLEGFELRPEQEDMATAVSVALNTGKHLIVEAGTGVGKSLAYLIPLAEWVFNIKVSDDPGQRRAVVSTYTKALQRQLVEKDLPFLRDNIFNDLRFALCVGSENYLCQRRLGQAKFHGLFDMEEAGAVDALLLWAKRTTTGLRSEIDVRHKLWQKVCRESDLCYGRACRHFNDCSYQKAKMSERKAHILVTNHHLFFANVVSDWNALPPFGPVVFDEAHELEDVAADYLGVEVSNYKLRNLLDTILNPSGKGAVSRIDHLAPNLSLKVRTTVNTVRMRGELFFNELSEKLKSQSTLRVREKGVIANDLSEALIKLSAELRAINGPSGSEDEEKELIALALRCEVFALSLRVIIEQELDGHVYWAERDGRRLRLVATPIDVSSVLKPQVFDLVSPAVMTSATLSTNRNFNYIKERLGLAEAGTLLLHSPFDYKQQAMLYLPDDIGEPNSARFEEDLIKRIYEILTVTMGRTLVLFTSYSLLTKTYNAISIQGLKILMQGDMDSYRLLQEFRRDEHSALFGTYTFWQGIDIPGDDLQCVIITRLPFAVPDEPVIEARLETLAREGKNPFYHYQIPQAIILLKQGFGRLIRTKTDKGVVAILDPRLRTKGYGRHFLKSLPECKIALSIDDIGSFINKNRDAALGEDLA